jgi:type VI secretion system Hcp family effector
MTTLSFRLTRVAVSAILAGGVTAALVLPGASPLRPAPTPPTDFWTAFSLASAQADSIYLEVDGFTGGDSTSDRHPNISTATQVDSGVNNTTNPLTSGGGGGGTAKSVPQQLVVTKGVDAYTPQFNHAASAANHLRSVTLHMSKGTDTFDFFQIDAADVFIQGEHVQLATGKDAVELVRMAFTKIQWTYRAQNGTGVIDSTASCWDFKANKDCTPPNNP